jgi:hypothetical protein
MKQLTDKQKKIIAIVVAILAVIHFGPRYLYMFLPAGAHAEQAKPSPAHYAPALPPTPPPAPVSPEAAAAGKYGGVWIGDALMPDQNRCKIQLEIRLSDDMPKKLKGYEQKSCMPLQPLAGGKLARGSIADVIRATSPVSAVMTGTALEGGVSFTVDQTIGTPGDGCSLSGFSITDFGSGQVWAQWQEGTCPTGKMLLRKARG